MGERHQYTPGTFSWTDLNTADTGAATDFYRGLFGWETHSEPIPGGGEYTLAAVDGRRVAALTAAPPGQHPAWLSYVAVDDADAATARASGLGASTLAGPFDVMTAGRMGLLQDPTGAVFAVWQAGESIGAELVNAPGALTLNQLNTRDPERATAFYAELFGWRIEAQPDTDVPYWGIYNGEQLNGGMMQLPDEQPAPAHWLVYFGSEDLDVAAQRTVDSGGTIVMPRIAVPGGEIVVAQDPQGAVFGLFEGGYDD